MRLPLIAIIVILLLSVAADVYIFCALRKRCWSKKWQYIYLAFSIAVLGTGLCGMFLPFRTGDNSVLLTTMWLLYTFISVYVAKWSWVLFDLISRIPQIFKHKRLRWLSNVGVLISTLTFATMWWGALVGRYDIEVNHKTVNIANLPSNFNGFTIAQISDLHLGTYGNDTTFVAELVDSINALRPDMIVFTGDIVNRRSTELKPFVGVLSRLKAPYGVYSILGNHDYGGYYQWSSNEARAQNLVDLKDLQKSMGWRLLLNEHEVITRGNQSIIVIGVENIGDPPYPNYGSLERAYTELSDDKVKVLLSHNPAHWEHSIADHSSVNIPLTLSGHTHAMQIEVAGISPGALRYRTWGGLYDDSSHSHQLYVNVGVGTVGFPARIGAHPEITLITLSSKQHSAKNN